MPWQCGMMLRLQFNNRVALSSCNRPVIGNRLQVAVGIFIRTFQELMKR